MSMPLIGDARVAEREQVTKQRGQEWENGKVIAGKKEMQMNGKEAERS